MHALHIIDVSMCAVCFQVIRSTVAITFILGIDELLYGACSSAKRKATFKKREFKIPSRKRLYKVPFVFVPALVPCCPHTCYNGIFEESDRDRPGQNTGNHIESWALTCTSVRCNRGVQIFVNVVRNLRCNVSRTP